LLDIYTSGVQNVEVRTGRLLCLHATPCTHISKAFIAQGLLETSLDVTHSFC
jgi:hypothetical protein